jgi:hypothetical protein
MDDQAPTDDRRTLRLWLELRVDDKPITGRLRAECGVDQEFVGWLGFVDALRQSSEAQSHERS